jgi:V/A-type H+-transporting ATPase subunit E
MEILRASDTLESEIVSDARNKARRLLESADKECAALLKESQRNLENEAGRLDAVREAKRARLRQELASSLPLETLRTRLTFTERAVSNALTGLFDGLSVSQIGRIVGMALARASFAFKDTRVVVSYAGMNAGDARRIVEENIPGAPVAELVELGEEEASEAGKGIILQSADGSRRFRATLNEIRSVLLEEYREELMSALLGKDVPR